jgi:hypothetical protein
MLALVEKYLAAANSLLRLLRNYSLVSQPLPVLGIRVEPNFGAITDFHPYPDSQTSTISFGDFLTL